MQPAAVFGLTARRASRTPNPPILPSTPRREHDDHPPLFTVRERFAVPKRRTAAMNFRTPTTWLIALLVVLVAGSAAIGLTLHAARQAGQQRLSAQVAWDTLEIRFHDRMAYAARGYTPFSAAPGVPTPESEIRQNQRVLEQLAPHARAEIETFVTLLLGLKTPDDAARQSTLALLLANTRLAVLPPLSDQLAERQRVADWALWSTLSLAFGCGSIALWRTVRAG